MKKSFPAQQKKRSLRLLLTAISLFACITIQAQWTSNTALNTPVSVAAGDQFEETGISDGASGAFIAWSDNRNGNSDIYMQHLDAAGNALWTSDGIVVCSAAGDQNMPVLASDGAGGAIITWNDQRNGSRDLYAQRVDAGGSILWTANGVVVCNAPGDQAAHKIIAGTGGGAIITWADYRGSDPDIYAQSVSASGTSNWTANGVVVCSAVDYQGQPILVTDGAGGAIISWMDSRIGGFAAQFYAQHVSVSGTTTWTSNGVAVCTAGGNRFGLHIVTTGSGGAILCWSDSRNGNSDIYAQQLDAGGTPSWTNNGQVICADAGSQDSPVMVTDGTGGAIIAWIDSRAGSYMYGQHIDGLGTGLWAADGISLCTTPANWPEPFMTTDGAGGAIVAFNYSYNLHAQRVDAGGNALWSPAGTAVMTGDVVYYAYVVEGVPGGAIVYFDTYRSGTSDIYAQNICAGGSVGPAPALASGVSGPATVCNGLSTTYTVAAVSGASYNWTLPSGWSGTSSTNTIAVTPGTTGGTISVHAFNSCGTSATQSMTASIIPVVASPDSVVGSAMVCSGIATSYSVAPVANATFYTWMLPSGWSGTSSTNTISVTPGSAAGTIYAAAANGCGSSANVQKSISLNTVPFIFGMPGPSRMCAGSTYTYSTYLSSGSDVTFNWVFPSDWAGTASSNSVTVTPGSTGPLSVTASNACGSSSTITATYTVDVSVPAAPDTLFGATTVCEGVAHSYSVTPMGGVQFHSWSFPSGWSTNGAGNPRSFTSHGSSGTISVARANACGTSPSFSLPVTMVTIPAMPAISGPASVCAGTSGNYSAAADTNVASYTWNVPSGWSGTSATDTIFLTAGSSGTITATATNGCGTSAAGALSVNVRSAAPVGPLLIDGPATVCSGTAVSYSVAAVSEADLYSWHLPPGWTGSSPSNTLMTIAGGNGTISLSASNGCGTSDTITLSITTDTIPPAPAAILGASTVCEGSDHTYAVAPVINASSYNWILPPGWTGVSTDDIVFVTTNAASGSLQVNAVNTCGASDTTVLSITVNTFPMVSTTQNDTSITAVQSGMQYQWLDCDNGHAVIAGAIAQSYTAIANGNYAVAINNNGCVDTSACVSINAIGLKTITGDELQLIIFPNPNTGSFIISAAAEGTYTITNALGQVVQIVKLNAGTNYKAGIEGLRTGVYYIHGNKSKQKIVVTE